MTPLFHLPPEILLQIASNLDKRESLPALSLVCRSARPIAQHQLFGVMRILAKRPVDWMSNGRAPWPGFIPVVNGEHTIINAMRTLKVIHTSWFAPEPLQYSIRRLSTLLPMMQRLTALELFGLAVTDEFMGEIIRLASRKRLALHFGDCAFSIPPNAVLPDLNITDFTLKGADHLFIVDDGGVIRASAALIKASARTLHSLTIHTCPKLLDRLIDVPLDALSFFSFSKYAEDEIFQQFFANHPSLEHIHTRYWNNGASAIKVDDLPNLRCAIVQPQVLPSLVPGATCKTCPSSANTITQLKRFGRLSRALCRLGVHASRESNLRCTISARSPMRSYVQRRY